MERYQYSLAYKRKANGKPLEARTQYVRIASIKTFFRWLCRQNHLLFNPASELEMPRFNHRLPQTVLNNKEVEIVLSQPDIRHIQALLGHVKITTTEIYTQVSIQKLKEIHTATHPAKLEKNSERLFKTEKDRVK